MAYNTIDKSTSQFRTKLYTGNGSARSITFDESANMQPDFIWLKARDHAYDHRLLDSIRGATKELNSNEANAEGTNTGSVTSFNSNGFNLGTDNGVNNPAPKNYVTWNWKAGGTAPAITYTVKVVSDGGNKYRFNDFGTSAVTLDLQEGGTYTFDQSDSSNSGHPLRFSTTSNGSHGGGSEYTTGVTTTGTPGSSGAKTVITVASGVATLYYYCTAHSGMGGTANTNSLFGSSNFDGNVQTTVSANQTAGFSIVKHTGTGSAKTLGHGLGAVPKMIMSKNLADSAAWVVYQADVDNTDYLVLNTDAAEADNTMWNDTTPTSSVFTVGDHNNNNDSNDSIIHYVFADVTGYSKFGAYTGNASTNGPFVYTGFKPTFLMIKRIDSSDNWTIWDDKRNTYNGVNWTQEADTTNNEWNDSNFRHDLLSNGFKLRNSFAQTNASNGTYIYMAFGQTTVGSNNIPATAR